MLYLDLISFSLFKMININFLSLGGVCKVSEPESDDEFVETLGYRYTSDDEGHGNREPVQVISFGHQRFTFVVCFNFLL